MAKSKNTLNEHIKNYKGEQFARDLQNLHLSTIINKVPNQVTK